MKRETRKCLDCGADGHISCVGPDGKTYPTMEARAISALQSTWGAIGYDVLNCEGDVESAVLTADIVREAVSSCGFVTGYPMDYGHDDEAVKWLEAQSYDEQERILAKAFPDGNYGL